AAARRAAEALLPSLLALEDPTDLSRHRAVVRTGRPRRFARTGATRDRPCRVGAGLGPRPHLPHDGNASRLVLVAAACVGRPDSRVSLPAMRDLCVRAGGDPPCRRVVRSAWVRRVVRAVEPRIAAAGLPL